MSVADVIVRAFYKKIFFPLLCRWVKVNMTWFGARFLMEKMLMFHKRFDPLLPLNLTNRHSCKIHTKQCPASVTRYHALFLKTLVTSTVATSVSYVVIFSLKFVIIVAEGLIPTIFRLYFHGTYYYCQKCDRVIKITI